MAKTGMESQEIVTERNATESNATESNATENRQGTEAASQPTDRAMMLGILDGDEDMLRHLLERHGPMIQIRLTQKFGNLLEVSEFDDVLNTAAYRVWTRAGQYNPQRGTLRGWFYRIAVNEAIDRIRRESGDDVVELRCDPGVRTRKPGDTSYKENGWVPQLLTAINILTPLQKHVVKADLAAGGQADDERLARLHNSTVKSIRTTRCAARKRLQQELGDLGMHADKDEPGKSQPADGQGASDAT